MKYRKKPIVIEAYQTDKEIIIHTLEGDMKADVGDYIITDVKGERYPCKSDIFEATYESDINECKTCIHDETGDGYCRDCGTTINHYEPYMLKENE